MRQCDCCKKEYDVNKCSGINVISIYNCTVPVKNKGKTGDYVLCDDCMRYLLAFLQMKEKE